MNDQDLILLMEEYFDGTISHEGRAALRSELQSNPAHRALFETQSRQNIRIHAQTSPIDFTESQRIAISVMDIVEQQHHPATFADILNDQTLRERIDAIREGLRAPRQSGKHRYARFVLMRFFGPPTVALMLSAIIIIVLMTIVPKMIPIDDGGDNGPIISLRPLPPESAPDPIAKEPDSAFLESIPVPSMSDPSTFSDPAVLEPTPSAANIEQPTPRPQPLPPPPFKVSNKALPHSIIGRDPINRSVILKQVPNSTQTERAVTNALQWLKIHQNPDGSWSGQDPVAMTGLALLTYLAHGETQNSTDYGPTIQRALEYLLSKQDSAGFFSKNVYAHAIATYAVAEAFTMTRIMSLQTAMNRGLAVIIAGQQNTGGFDYNYTKGARFDTSVSGWQIQAMKAAFIAGTDQPGLKDAIQNSIRFLQTLSFARDGSGFVYCGDPASPPAIGARWTMTGVGTLSLQLLGAGSAPQVRQGLKLLNDIAFEWPRDTKPSVYGFYYVTQAKYQAGNSTAWDHWNRQMQQGLLRSQHSDGHWEGGDYDQGSHVYTTTLCTLMLEVYYRYLPTFIRAPESSSPATQATGDVQVNVR